MEKQAKPGFFDIWARIKAIFRLLVQRWYFILAGMLIMGYVMYHKAKQKPITYSGSLVFMLADEEMSQGNSPGAFNIAAQLGLVNQNANSNKQLLKELLDSRKNIENTLFMEATIGHKTDLLVNHYIDMLNPDAKDVKDNPLKFKKNFTIGKDARRDSYLASLSTSIMGSYSSMIKESGVFITSFSSPSEEFTKEFLDKQVIAISEYYTRKKTEKSQAILEYAEKRRDSLSSILSGREYALARAVDQNIITIREEARVPEVRQKRNMEIVSEMYAEAVQNMEMAKMSVMKQTPFIQVVEDIRYPLIRSSRNIVRNVSMGLAIGFIIPVLLIIGIYFLNDFLKKEKAKYLAKKQATVKPAPEDSL